MYTLGIDASTQSCSAIIIDPVNGTIIAEHSINFGERLPQYNAPQGFITNGLSGEVHSDPCMWLDALELLLEDLSEMCDLTLISAISGAGQQHGSVYLKSTWFETVTNLDQDASLSVQIKPCLSRATAPIWMDNSTSEECAEIAAVMNGNDIVCAKSGSITIERFTGPQIRRFYKEDPEAYKATARIHLISSFFCSILSGSDAPIDTGDGAGMNLLNLSKWNWDPELLSATAPLLLHKLPPAKSGRTIIGQISPYFVSKFGFKENTSIAIFTGDNPSSLVGMGASQPGKFVISLGTSDTVFAAISHSVPDPDGCGHLFGNPMDGSMSLQCFVNGSLAREAVMNRFHLNWEQFTNALEQTAPGNEGALMLPFFRPEISPRIALESPLLCGDAEFNDWNKPEAAIRACVEGQCLNMRRSIKWMQLDTDTIYLTGGASKNDAVAQIVADVFQAKVQRLTVGSSVALGAAMRAAIVNKGVQITLLEDYFCKPDPSSTLLPSTESKVYLKAAEDFEALLQGAS